MLEKIISKSIRTLFPSRNFTVEKIAGRYVIQAHDIVGCNTYLLEETYPYEKVKLFNDLTGYSASYGYCKELGPVAFIGIPNQQFVGISGFFEYNVVEYGHGQNRDTYYFTAYSQEEEKNVDNYTVYGLYGLEKISKLAKVAKLSYVYDSRYQEKHAEHFRIFNMDCKLYGTYSYKAALILAAGTTLERHTFSGGYQPITFATVDENYHIGIIGIGPHDKKFIAGFKDTWEYGKEEPQTQSIRFLTPEQAKAINNFALYIYDYSFINVQKRYRIEKYDRTLDDRFCFHLSDGSDYRILNYT